MKNVAFIVVPVFIILIFASFVSERRVPKVIKPVTIARDTTFDMDAALAELREQIKGHENDPAPDVFKNIKQMKNVPAGKLLDIMQFVYTKALGVDCRHCHNPNAWDSEDKPEKQVTRDMGDMLARINNDLLPNIPNLESEHPHINCTTCHRGEVKPATRMPESH